MTRRNFFGICAAIPAGATRAVTAPPPLTLKGLIAACEDLKRGRVKANVLSPEQIEIVFYPHGRVCQCDVCKPGVTIIGGFENVPGNLGSDIYAWNGRSYLPVHRELLTPPALTG